MLGTSVPGACAHSLEGADLVVRAMAPPLVALMTFLSCPGTGEQMVADKKESKGKGPAQRGQRSLQTRSQERWRWHICLRREEGDTEKLTVFTQGTGSDMFGHVVVPCPEEYCRDVVLS